MRMYINLNLTLEIESRSLIGVNLKNKLDLKFKKGLWASSSLSDLECCNYYIVTVPTPVDKNNRPILTPL